MAVPGIFSENAWNLGKRVEFGNFLGKRPKTWASGRLTLPFLTLVSMSLPEP